MRRRCSEDGFTLIELMTVVLIVAILMAIAVPTLAGTRKRANDRSLHVKMRYAFGAERAYYIETLSFTDNAGGELTAFESGIVVDAGDTPVAVGAVYAHVVGDVLYLSGRSASGTCFYLFDDPLVGTGYARSAACGAAPAQTYVTTPW